MFISKVSKPFRATKKMHLAIVLGHDLLLQIYLHPQVCALLQKIHFQSMHQKLCLTIFHLVGNIIKAC